MTRVRWLVGALLVALAVAAVAGFFLVRDRLWRPAPDRQALLQQAAQVRPKHKAPNFALEDLDGKLHALSQWRGKLRLVNFWATWCGPCKSEIPALVDLQQRYGDRGLQVVGIATDEPSVRVVRQFASKYDINYPLLMDGGNAGDIARHLGFQLVGLPVSVLIGGDGTVLGYHIGPIDAAQMQKKVETILNGRQK